MTALDVALCVVVALSGAALLVLLGSWLQRRRRRAQAAADARKRRDMDAQSRGQETPW